MIRALAAAGLLLASPAALAQETWQNLPPPAPRVVAPPPPTAAPPVLDDPEPDPTPALRTGFSTKLSLAGTYRLLYGISFMGGDLGASLGGQTRKAAFYANASLFLGSTVFGLTTTDIQVGFAAEGRLGRFRVGGGVQFALLIIRRITSDSEIFDFTFGPLVQASYDLAQWDDGAFFVGLKVGADWLWLANDSNPGVPLMAHFTTGVGVRL